MSELENNEVEDAHGSFLSINSNFKTISIYLLWRSNIDDDFKIQAIFGKNLKYDFEPIDRWFSEHRSQIIVYRLEYKMPINNDEYTNISNRNNITFINKYHLRMTTKTMNISTNYDDSKQRIMNVNEQYQFLFDVRFQNHMLSSPKGILRIKYSLFVFII